jgi:CRP-like cAMP-binding protein
MALEHDMHHLSQVPVICVLESGARRLIAISGETQILRTGDLLFCEGEKSDGGFVVFEGSISLTRSGKQQSEKIVRQFGLIGQTALISQTERTATAKAAEPSVVLKISRTVFHRALREFPRSAVLLRGVMMQNLSEFSGLLERSREQWLIP